MKTYNIEIADELGGTYADFVVLADEFSEALDKAFAYMEKEKRKKGMKSFTFQIGKIELGFNIKEIHRKCGTVIQPSFV